MNTHHEWHEVLKELGKYPPLTHKKVRRRYRDLIKQWRHDTAKRKYGDLIEVAAAYMMKSDGSPENAHLYFFDDHKDIKQDDFIY